MAYGIAKTQKGSNTQKAEDQKNIRGKIKRNALVRFNIFGKMVTWEEEKDPEMKQK